MFYSKPSTGKAHDGGESSSEWQTTCSLLEDSPEALRVLLPEKVYGRRREISSGLPLEEIDIPEDIPEESQPLDVQFPEADGSSQWVDIEEEYIPFIQGTSGEPSTSGIQIQRPSSSRTPSRKACMERTCSKDVFLFRQLRTMKQKVNRLQNRNKDLKERMGPLRSSNMVQNLNNVNKTTIQFFISQQANQKLKKRGQRFSLDDKIFALSLYKQGGRGYRYLSKIFSLPSKRTLTKLLAHIPFKCGINSQIFQSLRDAVGKLNIKDRFCVLMFDEVALSPGLSYNFSGDFIEGIVDLGSGERRAQFADHALVFMIKGIRGKWKQPLSFYFCQSTTPTGDLVRIIKDMVRHVRLAGLRIVATISDQGATNVAAVNRLLHETKEYCLRTGKENTYQGYLIDKKEIVHLYDPPHLLKGIRNALLTKDLYFCQESIEKVATWAHIVALYNLDQCDNGKFSSLPKLSEYHVLPHKIKKMKVNCAAQVFSRSVGVVMRMRASVSNDLPTSSKYYLDPSATETADAILFFDELFDSVNGRSTESSLTKPLRGVVNETSPHVNLWNRSLQLLDSMSFKTSSSSNPIITPSLKHFKFTIRGFLYIWRTLKAKGFQSLSPRNFNQDPLENFFSLIRSHGVRNVNPNCTSFISSFKSLLINNFLSPHSPGANCEEDETCDALDTLKNFIQKKNVASQSMTHIRPPVYAIETTEILDVDRDLATPYVAGYLARKIMKNISNCPECLEVIEAYEEIPSNALIKAKTHPNCKMVNPSRTYTSVFREFSRQVFEAIPCRINSFNLKKSIVNNLREENILMLFCSEHKGVHKEFIEFGVKFILLFYIGNANKILCGRKSLHFSDPIMKMASEKYLKRRR